MKINEARSLFPALENKVFLDSASIGVVPRTAQQAVAEFMHIVAMGPALNNSHHNVVLDNLKSKALIEASRLFKTSMENLLLVESTTHGLNIAANSIPFERNDEVIVANIEYQQVAIPFVKKHEEEKLRLVQLNVRSDGKLAAEDILKLVTKNTKAICMSSVQWCTGQRTFFDEVGELCKARGIWLIVDGVQEAGALNVDLSRRYCDFYVAGGHKWLNAPYGCGVMYLSKRAQELTPPTYGYRNLPSPQEGWGKFFQKPFQSPFRKYDFPRTAQTFAIGGMSNYPGAIGLAESLKIVNDIGAHAVEEQVLTLANFLREQLLTRNIRVTSPEAHESSGITIFRLFDSHDEDERALEHLEKMRILLAIRYANGYGGIRAATHYFNNEEDILRLCHAIDAL